MFGVKLIVLLVCLSGFIAYLGDLLGRQVGKKKLTLLNLRPRHTAIVFSILTGFAIMITTMAVLSIVSKEARTALFGMEALQRKIRGYEKELQRTEKELGETRDMREKTQKDLSSVQTRFGLTRKKLSKSEQELTVSQKEARRLLLNMKTLQKTIHTLNHTKTSLYEKVFSLRIQAEDVFKRLKKSQDELYKTQREKVTLKTGKVVFQANEEILRFAIHVTDTPEQRKQKLTKALSRVNMAALQKGCKTDIAGEAIRVHEQVWEKLFSVISGTDKNILVRFTANQNTLDGEPLILSFQVVENTVIFKEGEVLAEDFVLPGESRDSVESRMFSLLKKGRALAVEKGFLPDPEGDVGSIAALEFVRLVDLILKTDVRLRVQLFATQDILIGGPLEVNYKVREARE